MTKLLYIASSPRGRASESGGIAEDFLDTYREFRPEATVDTLDLWAEPLPAYAREGVNAKMTVFGGDTPVGADADAWTQVRAVFDRFNSADRYLFAVPMWNANVPYVLKHLIDIITQPGLTFSFDPATGYTPLLTAKKAAVIYTAGVQPQDDPAFGTDFQVPFFTGWLQSIGITDITNIEFRPTILNPDPAGSRETAKTLARDIAKTF